MQSTRATLVVGADVLTAMLRTGSTVRTETVPLPAPTDRADDVVAAFGSVFAELAARRSAGIGARRAHVRIVLLPPYVDARLIALPPLRHAEAEAVIRRDAARHFVGGSTAKVVAVRMPPPRGRRRTDRAPVLAAAASAQLVEAIRAAAHRVGWRTEHIFPAHAAWIAAGERNARRSSSGTAVGIIAVNDDTAHLIRLQRGAVTVLRRVPATDVAAIVDALGGGPGATSIFADVAGADTYERALTAAGWTVIRGGAAQDVAATHARGAALELLPASVLVEQEQHHRALAARCATAAVLMLLMAAGVHLWGARRELDAVRVQRAALRPQVAPLLATRDSLDRLRERTATLRVLTHSPEWTRALFDIALLLPTDANVVSLRGTGDTLILSAQGARAGDALQALRGAASLRDVRLIGAVERDLEAGETTLERFTLQARVLPADSAAAPRSQ